MKKELKISEQLVQTMAEEFLMIGQRHKLESWELCAAGRLIVEWLEKTLGVEVKQVRKLE